MIVTRNGQPAAVLVSTDDLESLAETLATMSDRSLMAQIRESEKAVARGEDGVGLDELRIGLEHVMCRARAAGAFPLLRSIHRLCSASTDSLDACTTSYSMERAKVSKGSARRSHSAGSA